MQRVATIPLSLYIHFPWCLKKCPYCDFNSYKLPDQNLISSYINSLLLDLAKEIERYPNAEIKSIYFGGGTPSLISPAMISKIIEQANRGFSFAPNIEISLEANPGTIDLSLCHDLRRAGINRLSIGVQSFNDNKLKTLQRVHSGKEASLVIEAVRTAGFDNFNIDLMYGLPKQTVDDALSDLEIALSFKLSHLSWYQLSLIPEFLAKKTFLKPPDSEIIWDIEQAGQEFLAANGLKQYEISAYSSSSNLRCKHNINYWEYGDYLGIGAGAHSKITSGGYDVIRRVKATEPIKYLRSTDFIETEQKIAKENLPLEFMLNALRLYQPIKYDLFYERTGFKVDIIANELQQAQDSGMLELKDNAIVVTQYGKIFLNNLLEIFL